MNIQDALKAIGDLRKSRGRVVTALKLNPLDIEELLEKLADRAVAIDPATAAETPGRCPPGAMFLLVGVPVYAEPLLARGKYEFEYAEEK